MDYLEFIKNATPQEIEELGKAFSAKTDAENLWKNIKKTKISLGELLEKWKVSLWDDGNNETFIMLKIEGTIPHFYWKANFLHETYCFELTFERIFEAIRKNEKGIGHLISDFSGKNV